MEIFLYRKKIIMPRRKTTFAKGLLEDAIKYFADHGGQFVDDIAGSIVDSDVLKLIEKYTEGRTPRQVADMLDQLKQSDSQLFRDNHILEVMREMAHSSKPLAYKKPKGEIPSPTIDDLRMYNNMDFSNLLPSNVDAYLSNYVPKLQGAYNRAQNAYGNARNAIGNAYGNVQNSAFGNAIKSNPDVALTLMLYAAGGLGYGLSSDEQKRKIKTLANDAYYRGSRELDNGMRTIKDTLRSNEKIDTLADNINNAYANGKNTLNSMRNIISDSYTGGKQGKKPKTDYIGDALINALGRTEQAFSNAFGKRLSKKDSVMYKHADGKPNPIKYGSPYKNKFEK